MCYSAMVEQDLKKLSRQFDASVDFEAYAAMLQERYENPRMKLPKALDDALVAQGGQLAGMVGEWRKAQASVLEKELFTQKKRVADAERKLAEKVTKKAQDDVRIGSDKASKALLRLNDLKRTERKDRDTRIFPGVYSTVLVEEAGQRLLRPMRYQCRPAGKPSKNDGLYPGTYNARRDSLDGYWKGLFGSTHGLIVATRFYENVEGEDGKNKVLEFEPKTGDPMLIACLWSHWTDPKGKEPDLLSFAAITDDPEPEVAAAGHDRTIINIKPEHVDAWLNPRGDTAGMLAIFDDKQHPYYEHREAA